MEKSVVSRFSEYGIARRLFTVTYHFGMLI